MSIKNELIPKRRFKEFENADAWEQRKLGDITTFNKGKGYSKKDLVDNGRPIILYGRLYTDYQTLITKVDTFVAEVENSVISEGWEVIVPASGESAEDISRASVVAESGIILGGDLNIINKCSLLNPVFLALTISNGNQQKEMSKRAQGKSVVHLHNSDLKDINLVFPEIKEQLLIGEYFEKIDNLITLHQRKYDALKTMKKTLLSKMFPKDGEDVPEIRFKEFTDAWEQRKLGNVAKYRNGKAHEQSVSENGKYVIVNSKFVSTNGEVQKFSCEQIAPLFKNEIAFVLSDVPNGRAIARTFLIPHDDKYTLNQRIAGITPNETTDCYFLHLLMNRNHYFLRFDDGVKQTNLSVNDVMGFSTYYPLYEEQQLCGQFFQKIDNLITLHQRKLDELKNMKKTLLQQMFV